MGNIVLARTTLSALGCFIAFLLLTLVKVALVGMDLDLAAEDSIFSPLASFIILNIYWTWEDYRGKSN